MLLLYVTDTKPVFYKVMRTGDLHRRQEKQANLFSKAHVEHAY